MAKRALVFDTDSVSEVEPQKIKVEPLTPTKIKNTDAHATVEAAFACISPTKDDTTFFDGELTDGLDVIRLLGFDKSQHKTLTQFQTKGLSVTLKNCVVQQNKFTKKLEVVLKGYTQIEVSNAKFNLSKVATIGSDIITLCQLPERNDYDCVTVRIKVINISNPETVGKSKTKQEIFIADATAVANLTIWEKDVNKFQMGQCYQLNRFVVRSNRGKNTYPFHLWEPPS